MKTRHGYIVRRVPRLRNFLRIWADFLIGVLGDLWEALGVLRYRLKTGFWPVSEDTDEYR